MTIREAFASCPVKKTQRCKYKIVEIKSVGRVDPEIGRGIEVLVTKECVWCKDRIQAPKILWEIP